MTAFLDWISQHLTTAPLWIQSPIVILGAVLVCALLTFWPVLQPALGWGPRIPNELQLAARRFPPRNEDAQ